jgi:hypothetical protein
MGCLAVYSPRQRVGKRNAEKSSILAILGLLRYKRACER